MATSPFPMRKGVLYTDDLLEGWSAHFSMDYDAFYYWHQSEQNTANAVSIEQAEETASSSLGTLAVLAAAIANEPANFADGLPTLPGDVASSSKDEAVRLHPIWKFQVRHLGPRYRIREFSAPTWLWSPLC